MCVPWISCDARFTLDGNLHAEDSGVQDSGSTVSWIFTGFCIMVLTGALLFYAIPVKTYLNIVFRIKLLFLLILGTITDNFCAALNSANSAEPGHQSGACRANQ